MRTAARAAAETTATGEAARLQGLRECRRHDPVGSFHRPSAQFPEPSIILLFGSSAGGVLSWIAETKVP